MYAIVFCTVTCSYTSNEQTIKPLSCTLKNMYRTITCIQGDRVLTSKNSMEHDDRAWWKETRVVTKYNYVQKESNNIPVLSWILVDKAHLCNMPSTAKTSGVLILINVVQYFNRLPVPHSPLIPAREEKSLSTTPIPLSLSQ